MARCVTPNFTTTSTIYSTFQLFWLLVLLSSSLATELLSAVQTVCPVRRPRHVDTDTLTHASASGKTTTAKQRPCQKHTHNNGLYRTRPGRQARARKSTVSMHVSMGRARASMCARQVHVCTAESHMKRCGQHMQNGRRRSRP